MPQTNSFKSEVSYSFLNESNERFKNKVGEIIHAMENNPFFPNAQAKLALIKGLYDIFAPTVLPREKINSETAAICHAARLPLEAMVREFLPDVQAESKGLLEALLTTAIPLVHTKETPQMPYAPSAVHIYRFGNPPQIFFQCEVQPNAQLYYAQVSRDRENWLWQASDVKSAVSFSDLPVGEILYVQMCVKNSVGKGYWSAAIPFYIPPPGVSVPIEKRPVGVR